MEPTDDPLEKHARFSPRCAFLICITGGRCFSRGIIDGEFERRAPRSAYDSDELRAALTELADVIGMLSNVVFSNASFHYSSSVHATISGCLKYSAFQNIKHMKNSSLIYTYYYTFILEVKCTRYVFILHFLYSYCILTRYRPSQPVSYSTYRSERA